MFPASPLQNKKNKKQNKNKKKKISMQLGIKHLLAFGIFFAKKYDLIK